MTDQTTTGTLATGRHLHRAGRTGTPVEDEVVSRAEWASRAAGRTRTKHRDTDAEAMVDLVHRDREDQGVTDGKITSGIDR